MKELLWLLFQENTNIVFAIIHQRAFPIVIAHCIFHSLTVLSDGIPPKTVFIMAMLLYMLTASDSKSKFPVFPMLHPASMYDFHVEKLLLNSPPDPIPYYQYCKRSGTTPFIDLNEKRKINLNFERLFPVLFSIVIIHQQLFSTFLNNINSPWSVSIKFFYYISFT